MTIQLLAVDPGETTGWALWSPGSFTSDEDPYEVFNDRAEAFLKTKHVGVELTVVVERFVINQQTIRKGRNEANWSIETLGLLRHWCRHEGHALKLQMAADAMKFATNDRLRACGWYARGKGHANDAARHALLAVAELVPEHIPEGVVPP